MFTLTIDTDKAAAAFPPIRRGLAGALRDAANQIDAGVDVGALYVCGERVGRFDCDGPDLPKLLKTLLGLAVDSRTYRKGPQWAVDAIIQAREAIAKAEGRS